MREGVIELEVIKRGVVKLEVDSAHALIGLGFDYRFASDEAKVVQVLTYSPAGRSGMKAGDVIVTIDGEKTKKLGYKGVKSALNSVPAKGVEIVVLHTAGTTETMRLKNGPVYPIFSELGGLQ
jgi:C-terminal processing protease CtpA/Prc